MHRHRSKRPRSGTPRSRFALTIRSPRRARAIAARLPSTPRTEIPRRTNSASMIPTPTSDIDGTLRRAQPDESVDESDVGLPHFLHGIALCVEPLVVHEISSRQARAAGRAPLEACFSCHGTRDIRRSRSVGGCGSGTSRRTTLRISMALCPLHGHGSLSTTSKSGSCTAISSAVTSFNPSPNSEPAAVENVSVASNLDVPRTEHVRGDALRRHRREVKPLAEGLLLDWRESAYAWGCRERYPRLEPGCDRPCEIPPRGRRSTDNACVITRQSNVFIEVRPARHQSRRRKSHPCSED